MKNRHSKPFRLSLAAAAALVLHSAMPAAFSAIRYWDGGNADIPANGNNVSAGGTGTWNTTLLNWDAGAVPHVAWNNAANDTAEINGGTQALTLDSAITVGGITQKAGGSGASINEGTGLHALTLGQNSIFSVAASTTTSRGLNVNASVTGNFNLSIVGPTMTPGGFVNLNRINSYTGATTVTNTTLRIGFASSPGQLGNGTYANTISIGASGAFQYSSSLDQTLSGLISGAGALSKTSTVANTGTLTLTNNNTGFTGSTTVTTGTLAISSTGGINASSGVTINGGTFRYHSPTDLIPAVTFTSGTLAGTNWNGTLAGQTIGTGQTISPGNSPGMATTAGQTWATGGSFLMEINDASGTAGLDPGWDLVNGSGALNITATSGAQFSVLVNTLTLGNTSGPAANFNDALAYNWLIADFNTVTGFSADAFSINTAGFANSFTGSFGVSPGGAGSVPGDSSQLYLTYSPVPEVNTALLSVFGFLAIFRRRR